MDYESLRLVGSKLTACRISLSDFNFIGTLELKVLEFGRGLCRSEHPWQTYTKKSGTGGSRSRVYFHRNEGVAIPGTLNMVVQHDQEL